MIEALDFSLLSVAYSGSTKLIEATEWLQRKLDRCCAGKLTVYANIISVHQILLQFSLECWRLCVYMNWNCSWKCFTKFIDPDWWCPFFSCFHGTSSSTAQFLSISIWCNTLCIIEKKKSIKQPQFFFQKLQKERYIFTYISLVF